MFDFKREPNTRPLILDQVTGTVIKGDNDNNGHGHDDDSHGHEGKHNI
jgi:hypothetical protein